MLEHLVTAFGICMRPINLLGLIGGMLLGTVFGAVPGLTSITAVVLVLPFTYGMEGHLVFVILVAAYCGAIYAGSVPAVLFHTPGTAAAMMTTLDGYPLALKGRGGEALSVSAIASALGGFFGALAMIAFTPLLADFALSFGPAEYLAMAVFGMSAVTSIGTQNQAKALVAMLLGIMVALVGADNFRGMLRFTFGSTYLISGFDLVPVLAGVLALSEVFKQSERLWLRGATVVKNVSVKMPRLPELLRLRMTLLRASIIGTVVGALPGTGAVVASVIAYNEERRWSKQPEKFGTGLLEGVAAPEAANNAATSAALIPTVALGIPGSPTAAALMGAFLIQGLCPGPMLLFEKPTLVMTIFLTLVLSSVLIVIIGLFGVRLLSRAMEIPYAYIAPAIVMFTIWGTYSVRNNPWDIVVTAIFGVVGYALSKFGYPLGSFVLGFILGPIAETSLLHSMALYDRNPAALLTRPLVVVLCVLSLITLLQPFIRARLRKARAPGQMA